MSPQSITCLKKNCEPYLKYAAINRGPDRKMRLVVARLDDMYLRKPHYHLLMPLALLRSLEPPPPRILLRPLGRRMRKLTMMKIARGHHTRWGVDVFVQPALRHFWSSLPIAYFRLIIMSWSPKSSSQLCVADETLSAVHFTNLRLGLLETAGRSQIHILACMPDGGAKRAIPSPGEAFFSYATKNLTQVRERGCRWYVVDQLLPSVPRRPLGPYEAVGGARKHPCSGRIN